MDTYVVKVENNKVLVSGNSPTTLTRGAYDYLKKRELIESVPGKGYYIKKDDLVLKAKVFLLFNKLSGHKKIIYDAFAKELGDNATIDFFIYDNNYRQFKNLIEASKARNYTHFTIICHFEEGGEDLINFINNQIPIEKLIILDKKVELLGSTVGCIYQDFEKNIYEALAELNPQLKKYKQIKLLLRKRTYHPIEIKSGFIKFCGQYAYDFKIVEEIENETIEKDTAYINLMENDLVILIKKIKETNFVLGKDVGIISYNDTPLKEILLDGITVISTDFEQMGKKSRQIGDQQTKIPKGKPFLCDS